MDAIKLLVDGSTKAALLIMQDEQSIDLDKLASSLRITIKNHIAEIQLEWREALASRLPEAWLHTVLNTQCLDMGRLAVDLYRKGSKP